MLFVLSIVFGHFNIFNLARPIQWWISNRFPPNCSRSTRLCGGSIPHWNGSSSRPFYLDCNQPFLITRPIVNKTNQFDSVEVPLRTNECPSLIKPDSISTVKFTDLFLEKLSTFTCSTSLSICSSVNVLFRKLQIFLISFLISLNNKTCTHHKCETIKQRSWWNHLFHIFEEEEEHVGVISIRPGVQDGGEIWSPHHCELKAFWYNRICRHSLNWFTFALNEIVGELFQCPRKLEEFYHMVKVIERYQSVFGVSSDVNDLKIETLIAIN